LSPFLQNNMAESSWELPNLWPEWLDSSQANIQHTSNWSTTRSQDLGDSYQQTLPIQQTVYAGQSEVPAGSNPSPLYSISESLNFPEPVDAFQVEQVAQRSSLNYADDLVNHRNKSPQNSPALQVSISTAGHAPLQRRISASAADLASSLLRTNEFFTQCDHHHRTTRHPSSSRSVQPPVSLTSPAAVTSRLSLRD